jgi:hypothetical protein
LASPSFWTPGGGSEELVFVSPSTLTVSASPGPASSPFALSGRIGLIDMQTGATLVDQLISGAGTANWQFVTSPTGGQVLSGVTYQFSNPAPTPEPASLVLLTTGLATLAGCWRGKRKTRLRAQGLVGTGTGHAG